MQAALAPLNRWEPPARARRNIAFSASPRALADGEFYRTLMESSPLIFFDYSFSRDLLSVSLPAQNGPRGWRSLCGFRRAIPESPRIDPRLRHSLLHAIELYHRRALRGNLSLRLDLSGQGDFRWYLATLLSLPEKGGQPDRIMGYLRDAQEEKLSAQRLEKMMHAHRQLQQKASTDAVTGLLNRAALEERVSAALHASDAPCYYFIFDIDNFKTVNDCAGHAEGDRALRMVACVLRRYTRPEDPVGRIGGDEFVALLCGLPSPEAAMNRAQCILAAVRTLKSPALRQGQKCLSLSVGMAMSTPERREYDALYRAADRALYRAKGLGKDRCCMAEE